MNRRKTTTELSNDIADIVNQIEHLHRGIQVVLAECNIVSTLLLHDLKERGKLRQANCVNCGALNNIPLIEGMEVDLLQCRFCGKHIDEKEEEE